jgi:hypothetical protein
MEERKAIIMEIIDKRREETRKGRIIIIRKIIMMVRVKENKSKRNIEEVIKYIRLDKHEQI